jgi:DnaJ-class molecular chaperone
MFLDVQQAYETLSNPRRRAQYDATLPPKKK